MAIAAWHNMARDNGQSPSQLFFGRIQRKRLPMLAKQTDNGSKCIEAKDTFSKASTDSRDSKTKNNTNLPTGSLALMHCHISKKWEKTVQPRESGTSYVVEGVSKGKQYMRGRRLVKPYPDPYFHEDSESSEHSVKQELQR